MAPVSVPTSPLSNSLPVGSDNAGFGWGADVARVLLLGNFNSYIEAVIERVAQDFMVS